MLLQFCDIGTSADRLSIMQFLPTTQNAEAVAK